MITLIILGFVVYILSKLSMAYEGISKCVPVMGKVWHDNGNRRARIDQELADLRRVVTFQGIQLEELRGRDEMNWSWILTDQEWHRQEEFRAATEGRTLTAHVSFMEYRDIWVAARMAKRAESPF